MAIILTFVPPISITRMVFGAGGGARRSGDTVAGWPAGAFASAGAASGSALTGTLAVAGPTSIVCTDAGTLAGAGTSFLGSAFILGIPWDAPLDGYLANREPHDF